MIFFFNWLIFRFQPAVFRGKSLIMKASKSVNACNSSSKFPWNYHLAPDLKLLLGLEDNFLLLGPPFTLFFSCVLVSKSTGRRLFASPSLGLEENIVRWRKGGFPVGSFVDLKISPKWWKFIWVRKNHVGCIHRSLVDIFDIHLRKNGVPLIMF